jgi:hypothetical protein
VVSRQRPGGHIPDGFTGRDCAENKRDYVEPAQFVGQIPLGGNKIAGGRNPFDCAQGRQNRGNRRKSNVNNP